MILYGQSGQAVGSADRDWLFDRDGTPIGIVQDNHVFSTRSGQHIGVVSGGMIRDTDGVIRAYGKNARLALAQSKPRVVVAIPQLQPIGPDVTKEPTAEKPQIVSDSFLVTSLSQIES